MIFKFTDTEIKKALKEMVILVDTREKKNEDIISWFEKKNIKYKIQKIHHGDYSAYIPGGTLRGIDNDIYFDRDIVIEKKQSIDEIAGNFSKEDVPRFKSEFAHLQANKTKVFIFVQNPTFDNDLRNGLFRSGYDPTRLYQRIKGLEAEYNTIVRPVSKEYIASEIYNTLYYQVRHILVREFEIRRCSK